MEGNYQKRRSLWQEFVYCVTKKFSNSSGRARRREFWGFVLFSYLTFILFLAIAFAISSLIFTKEEMGNHPISIALLMLPILYYFSLFIPGISVAIRRLHDTDRRGTWLLIFFIPTIGLIALFVIMLLDSNPYPNRYGEDPKAFERAQFKPQTPTEISKQDMK